MTQKAKNIETKLSTEKLLEEISKGEISSIYLIHGEEEYLIKKDVKSLTEAIIPKENIDFNLENIDGTTNTPENIITIADTYPFFESKKILHIENYSGFSDKKNSIDLSLTAIQQDLELFESKNDFLIAEKILSQFDLQIEDMKNMSNFEFKELIQKKLETDIPGSLIAIIENLYLFLIQNEEKFESNAISDQNDLLESYLNQKLPDYCCFIFSYLGKISKKKSIYKLIEKKGKIIECTLDKENFDLHIENLIRELKTQSITITPKALKKLKEKTGINLRQIYKEIDKVINFLGAKKIIDENDIDLLVSRTESEKIYELTDSLAEKNIDKTLLVLKNLVEDGIFPLQIMAGIINKFRNLMQCKLLVEEDLIPKNISYYPVFQQKILPNLKEHIDKLSSNKQFNILKQHPFVIFKSIQQSNKFSMTDLKNIYFKLLETDKNMKLSSRPPIVTLEMLILNLTS